MDIAYKTRKMRKIFNSAELLLRQYGSERARKIKMRQDFMRAAENLAQIPTSPPMRRHELKGNLKGRFAVDLTRNYRLVFEPNHHPVPATDDGGIDLEAVTAITILSVEDYHDD